ncbi:BRCT domain containing protein [Rhodotorula toruloides]|uniref:BRCT domain containing protein n=1 Tax=Rhodotorula toruloides TaxID=5286 RepID=A0A511KAH3_RHOTO|nr:BRCT domain containing protein [Rhodotorula toruloides]
MVWVVEGTLQSTPGDGPEVFPSPTSHYLRPSRRYRIGRAGGIRAPAKASQTKLGPASKKRPYDFRIASLSVSKEGLAEFETGGEEWVPEDRPELPTNSLPYSLTVTLHKRFLLARGDDEPVELELENGAVMVEVQDGDRLQERSKGYWFQFRWVPINLCFAAATSADKKKQHEAARAMGEFLILFVDEQLMTVVTSTGIKIAYRDTRPHHTHFVVKRCVPNAPLLRAAMHLTHVVSHAWYDELLSVTAALDFPAEPLPVHPGPPPEGASKEEMTAHDKEVARYEKELLAMNEDVGGDPTRWWGHCHLENDWDGAWPSETEAKNLPAAFEHFQPTVWARNDARRDLFKDVLVVSFRGRNDADDRAAELVNLGGGSFFSCDVFQQTPPPSSVSDLLDAINTYKTDHGLMGGSKVAIIPPPGVFVEPGEEAGGDGAEQQRELIEDLQRALRVGKVCNTDNREIAEAIYEVDLTPLQGPELPPQGAEEAAATSRQTQRTQASQFTQATPPFPTGGVPGTHPESVYGEGSTAVGPAPAADDSQAQGSSTQTQPTKRLTRRARTGRTILDNLFEDEDDEASGSTRPLTQDLDGGLVTGTLVSTSAGTSTGAGMAVDAGREASPATPAEAPPATGRLRRRAGQKTAVDLLLGDDSPEQDRGGTQSMHEELMRTKKTREERLKAIEEEDQRLAREEMQASQAAAKIDKGKGRADEEAGGRTVAAARRKRGKSAALGSSDEDDSQPANKRTTKKTGDAPLTSTKKRSRADSRDPGASTPSDDDSRTSRKKSKAPEQTSPVPAPKNKKEAAALKKAEKEAREREAAQLLQIKPTKRKGAEVDRAFNEDFNALKIVKPVITHMPAQEKHRMGWEEEDSDVERDRLISANQDRLIRHQADDSDDDMDPDNWRRPTQAMFVIKTLDVERKERPPPRTDINLDPRWAGRPNFKKFRPKNSRTPRPALAARPQISLVLPEFVDYGLGPGYNERKGTAFSQVQRADDEDDEDDLYEVMTTSKGQLKLNFSSKTASKSKASTSKAKPKAKGKAKRVLADSDDDSDAVGSSNTVRGDDMEVDELDDDAATQRSTTSDRSGSRKVLAKRAAPARKAAPATIMIDDDDSDSDSGLTFKGFGKKAASGRAR